MAATDAIEVDDDRPVPLGQEANLNTVADLLAPVLDVLPPFEAGLALIAAGLDLLPAAHCEACYRAHLVLIQAEIERLLDRSSIDAAPDT